MGRMFYVVVLISLLPYIFDFKTAIDQKNNNRTQKALSVFTVVKFENDACESSTAGKNGTCYTSSECTAKGGSSSGSCASSFGVCCVFEKSCGDGTVSENNTYFSSSSRTLGSSCTLTICKSSTDVCQLRLDFETFSINNPVTSTTSQVGTNAGAATAIGFNLVGTCQTDFFSVTVPGGKAPPLICGTNTGYHMYVPAADECNVLSSFFGSSSTSSSSAFTIKVTQVECNSKLRAPENCLQYFTASSGTIDTFNYQSGSGTHLANQDYCSCIRAERTACTVCMSSQHASGSTGLGLGGGVQAIHIPIDTFCGFPTIVASTMGPNSAIAVNLKYSYRDYIELVGGQCDVTAGSGAGAITYTSNDRYCGATFQCVGVYTDTQIANGAVTGSNANTVCTSTKPFQLCVNTDGVEAYSPAADLTVEMSPGTGAATSYGYLGYRMTYWQKSTCLYRN